MDWGAGVERGWQCREETNFTKSLWKTGTGERKSWIGVAELEGRQSGGSSLKGVKRLLERKQVGNLERGIRRSNSLPKFLKRQPQNSKVTPNGKNWF